MPEIKSLADDLGTIAPTPTPEHVAPFVAPSWLSEPCRQLGLRFSVAYQPLATAGAQLIGHLVNFDWGVRGEPAADDLYPLLRCGFQVGDDRATRAAIDAYCHSLASDLAAAIVAQRELRESRAATEAKRAERREAERQAAAERDERMARSEFECQSVLAEEAEKRKWEAFEAEKGQFEAWKTKRESAGA